MEASYLVLWLTAGTGLHGSGWSLVPGLAINGLGMGMVMGPLISRILQGVRDEHAGSASGVLTTVQQVAGALDVALIGVISYGILTSDATPSGYLRAFRWSLVYTFILVAVLVQLLRSHHTEDDTHQRVGSDR